MINAVAGAEWSIQETVKERVEAERLHQIRTQCAAEERLVQRCEKGAPRFKHAWARRRLAASGPESLTEASGLHRARCGLGSHLYDWLQHAGRGRAFGSGLRRSIGRVVTRCLRGLKVRRATLGCDNAVLDARLVAAVEQETAAGWEVHRRPLRDTT